MKKLLVLLPLISFGLHAQSGISFGVYQDIKLGLGMDKEHGNDKPTIDMVFVVNWECLQKKQQYYHTVQLFYEHANLHGGYFRRYGVNSIWNFNELIVERFTAGLGIGGGIIHRNGEGTFSYGIIGELRYNLFKNLDIGLRNEFVKRNDLPNKKLGYNLAIGITLNP